MGDERGIAQRDSADPVLRPTAVSLEAFVFSHRPTRKAPVQIAQRRLTRRLTVTAIVRNPTSNDGVEHMRQVVDPSLTAAKLPIANFLSDRLGRRIAYTARSHRFSRASGSEGIAQIVEFFVEIVSSSIIILAVDDLGLGRMACASGAVLFRRKAAPKARQQLARMLVRKRAYAGDRRSRQQDGTHVWAFIFVPDLIDAPLRSLIKNREAVARATCCASI